MTPFPRGPFDILLADPPWRTEFGVTDSRSAERHYRTMPLPEILALGADLPVADDALLFLWATAPMIRQALEVVEAWGFRYRTQRVWCKPGVGIGQWVRNAHELLLIGRRGTFPTPPPALRPSSVIHAPRGRHSEKPESVAADIERACPGRRYLELFARRPRPGWTCWGDELPEEAAS